MKTILAAEKKTSEIEKRLTENIEEISGIEKVDIFIIISFNAQFCT